MSLYIIKAGIFDTIQDGGRWGFQHLGINPGGAMDRLSAQIANCLLGKERTAPVIEIHFPASHILFEQDTVICITGAHFTPVLNDTELPLHQPVVVRKNSVLRFQQQQGGVRCYLSLLHHFDMQPWLNSYSTHIKAEAGGLQGRKLTTGDRLPLQQHRYDASLAKSHHFILHWKWKATENSTAQELDFIPGNEWYWLTEDAAQKFQTDTFFITNQADRMGYRLLHAGLKLKETTALVSSAVTYGTVQLLPNGQLIILMADHQTTGGYPRIAHIASAHLHRLAQMGPKAAIRFKKTEQSVAEQNLMQQQMMLQQLETAGGFNIENIFKYAM